MTRVVFPGTFDPITRGHEVLAQRAARVFDELIVGVAAGVHKESFFTLQERLQLTTESFAATANIHVFSFEGLLANFMRQQQSRVVIRGLRAVSDFEFESQLASINKALDDELETVFFLPDHDFIYLSSTVVREVGLLRGDVQKFVSPHVARALWQKLHDEKS